ncbi:undecaprenyl diphosphate synthase [Lachnospiraceae bacterium A10]|jgi:undecaprenyl diphosphate synthase|nr:undecaprenyl diphosphate synthase [Lachnospiraceae bacterium A10]
MSVPKHVAIILDGNGRWAKKKGMPRSYGHTVGAKNVETICEAADDLGVKYLTLYAFSTENWNRPDDEVNALMKILANYLKTCKALCKKHGMRIRILGDITRLEPGMQKVIRELEEETKEYPGLNLQIALNYGSRDEIVRAARAWGERVATGECKAEELTEEVFNSYLDSKDIPDPDLMIRTGGEERLSNFLLWQVAYSEFIFVDVPWPDFKKSDLAECIEEFENRNRRFGKV